jgi:DNA-binding Xre family transcriptional regulator
LVTFFFFGIFFERAVTASAAGCLYFRNSLPGEITMEVMTLKYPSLSLPLGPQREKALKHIGGNIRRERTARLISQEKFAALVGINARTVARVEAGQLNIRPETLEKIREALGCPLVKLIGQYQPQPKTVLRVAGAQINFLQRLCGFL